MDTLDADAPENFGTRAASAKYARRSAYQAPREAAAVGAFLLQPSLKPCEKSSQVPAASQRKAAVTSRARLFLMNPNERSVAPATRQNLGATGIGNLSNEIAGLRRPTGSEEWPVGSERRIAECQGINITNCHDVVR